MTNRLLTMIETVAVQLDFQTHRWLIVCRAKIEITLFPIICVLFRFLLKRVRHISLNGRHLVVRKSLIESRLSRRNEKDKKKLIKQSLGEKYYKIIRENDTTLCRRNGLVEDEMV